MTVCETCKLAKENVSYPALLTTDEKNRMLGIIADALIANSDAILKANEEDITRGKDLPTYLIDRLRLTESRIAGIAEGIRQLIALDDPVGKVLASWVNHDGLEISRVSVPLGVIGIIYEARPNVTCDVVALCIKTGNAIVLRGSKDAYITNSELVRIIKSALEKNGFESGFIQLIEDTTREGADEFMHMDEYIDVLVPRGSAGLIKATKKNATIPVIETGAGNCHLYMEKTGDLSVAEKILINGKLQRPGVCNALESMLIDRDILAKAAPVLLGALAERNVTIHACAETISACPELADKLIPATEDDYAREYLGYEISCKAVSGVDEAIAHINKYGTHHSEVIITNDESAADKFLREVDSSAVYVNASTRYTDGFEFGFGAELGISTQKLHVRGPIGPEQLTSFKYVIHGNGQCRK